VDNVVFRPAKLLITITNKRSGDVVLAAIRKGSARGATMASGRGLAQYFTDGGDADGEITETLVFSLMYEEADSVLRELLRAGLENPELAGGLALVLDAAMMVRPGGRTENTESAPQRAGSERMSTGNTLITCILTRGHADEVMTVARQAGARGGTILNARGTAAENDVKFFGISLVPEKEMLLIAVHNDNAQTILEAVCALPVFSEPGGGIVYTTLVEECFTFSR